MAEFEQAEILKSIFDGWPSFHDAEVLRLTLDRSGADNPTLELAIHVFEMTTEIDSQGHYVLRHHTEVLLTFTEVVLTRCRGFNHQNVLESLDIEELLPEENEGRHFRVTMPSSYGLECEFECNRAIVTAVRPFEPAD